MMGKNTRDNLHVTCDCPKTHSGPYGYMYYIGAEHFFFTLGELITWALIERQSRYSLQLFIIDIFSNYL